MNELRLDVGKLFKIVEKTALNPSMTKMVIDAPFIARKALPGQFIILRVDEHGERIPLTIADYDREKGTVTIRHRDSMAQTTLSVEEALAFIDDQLNF